MIGKKGKISYDFSVAFGGEGIEKSTRFQWLLPRKCCSIWKVLEGRSMPFLQRLGMEKTTRGLVYE